MAYIPTLKSKYHNVKTVVDGIKFDSKREAKRYSELRLLEKAGEIMDLQMQSEFHLIPPQVIGGKKERGINYIADFVYRKPDGTPIVEDVKGMRTDAYRMKRKLMKHILGIEIVEVS